MISKFFKLIVGIVFMINMQFSIIDCNEEKIVALLKIIINQDNHYVPEIFDMYTTRNTQKFDPDTQTFCIYSFALRRYLYAGEVINEGCYNVNENNQIILKDTQADGKIGAKNLVTLNLLKQREFAQNPLLLPEQEIILSIERQRQFYKYSLFPFEDETIYHYWSRVDTQLVHCLRNNAEFDFIDSKVDHIEEIGMRYVLVLQDAGETDEAYQERMKRQQKWFENLISTKPLFGEGVNNYRFRVIRLGFTPLTTDHLKIFYSEFILQDNCHPKIYDIKNNFSATEFFITHIIIHCPLPDNVFIRTTHNVEVESLRTQRKTNVRGESSQPKDRKGKKPRRGF